MALTLQNQRDLARWYPLKEHPVQRALVEAVSKDGAYEPGRDLLHRGADLRAGEEGVLVGHEEAVPDQHGEQGAV